MADESSVAAGKRFARDMKRIREDRGFSVEELHKETRIARSLIQSFEEGGLYDHSTFNEVYLRSFVRAYAEALGIAPEAVLDGLEAALNESYDDQLAQQYLQSPASAEEGKMGDGGEGADASASPDRSPPRAPVAGGPEGRGGLVGPPRALGEEGPSIGEGDGASQDDDSDQDDDYDASAPSSSADERRPSSEEAPTSSSQDAPSQESAGDDEDEPREEPARASAIEDEKEREASPPENETEDDKEPPAEPDEADDESLNVRPSWMDEEPEDEDEVGSASTVPSASEGASPDAAPASPIGEAEDTGIVGEPTAMGEGAEQGPPHATGSESRSGAAARLSRDPSGWSQFLRGERQEMLWAGLGIAVVVVVLIGLGVAFFSSGEAPDEAPARTAPTATDTAATASPPDTTAAPELPPPTNVTLGPSIPLTVLATDNVSGIRIRRDDDLRRPYWIGEGQAQVFPFEQRVTIQNELTDVKLFLAGYPYPVSPADTAGGLEITRSQAEAFVDTLRGAPASLSVTPDTIAVGAPDE